MLRQLQLACILSFAGIPYLYVTVVLCNSVAAQVHVDTTDDATRPDLRDRPAVVNSSEVCCSKLYRFKLHVIPSINRANKNPMPMVRPYLWFLR
jgi:hypothetical protein